MWSSILSIAIKLVGFFLGKVQASTESQQRFFDFIEAMQKDGFLGANSRISVQKQIDRLKEMAKKKESEVVVPKKEEQAVDGVLEAPETVQKNVPFEVKLLNCDRPVLILKADFKYYLGTLRRVDEKKILNAMVSFSQEGDRKLTVDLGDKFVSKDIKVLP